MRVDVHYPASTVEIIFLNGRRVALHARGYVGGGFTTSPEHMPSNRSGGGHWE